MLRVICLGEKLWRTGADTSLLLQIAAEALAPYIPFGRVALANMSPDAVGLSCPLQLLLISALTSKFGCAHERHNYALMPSLCSRSAAILIFCGGNAGHLLSPNTSDGTV